MLDEARKSNWTPRSTFRHAKQVSQAIRSIENRTGRDARSPEIAEALGVSLEEYHRMVESAASSRLLSYEQLADDPERASMLPELPEDGPEALLEGDQFREALGRAVAALPERERLVLSLYYDQELNLREIGAVLSVSESRVCQIHGQAVLRIRARLDEFFNDGERESLLFSPANFDVAPPPDEKSYRSIVRYAKGVARNGDPKCQTSIA
jgi:RNA polymerase sigma factor for flagellar operon FliA